MGYIYMDNLVFIPLNIRKPEYGQMILVKTNVEYLPYYVCTLAVDNKDRDFYVEAGGEEYSGFNANEIIGWIPIESLDQIAMKKTIEGMQNDE